MIAPLKGGEASAERRFHILRNRVASTALFKGWFTAEEEEEEEEVRLPRSRRQ